MKKIWLFFGAIAVAATSQSGNAQTNNELRVGQVIGNEQGQVINGWRQIGGAHYQKRTNQNYVTAETDECCVTAFRRGDAFLFAQTEPIARRASGGVEAERIVRIKKFVVPAIEVQTDCSLMWIMPVTSFYNRQTKVIRSIIFDGTDFVQIRWFDTGAYCDHGD